VPDTLYEYFTIKPEKKQVPGIAKEQKQDGNQCILFAPCFQAK
jgi:hypothetical protein